MEIADKPLSKKCKAEIIFILAKSGYSMTNISGYEITKISRMAYA